MQLISLEPHKYVGLYNLIHKSLVKINSLNDVDYLINSLNSKYQLKTIQVDGYNLSSSKILFEVSSVLNHKLPSLLYKVYMDNILRYVIEEDTLEVLNVAANSYITNELNIRYTYISELIDIINNYFVITVIDEFEVENLLSLFLQAILSNINTVSYNDLSIEFVNTYYNLETDLRFILESKVKQYYSYRFELYNNTLVLFFSKTRKGSEIGVL